MKRERHICALLICIFFITSCAVSPLQKSLVNEERPEFVGSITPITVPIQPEYQPVNLKTNESMAANYFITFNTPSGKQVSSEESEENSFNFTLDVKRLGDLLTWNTKWIDMTIQGKGSLKPNIPLGEVTLLTSKYGDLKESEIAFPFFEQQKIRSKIGDKELEKIKKQCKDSLVFSVPLTQKPVITGDILYKTKLIEFLSEDPFWKTFINKIPEEPALIVRGWGYFEGRKVLVSEINSFFQEQSGDNNRIIQIKINGYNLTNPENFMPVKGDIFIKATVLGVPRSIFEELLRANDYKEDIPPFTTVDMTTRIRIIFNCRT